MIGNGPAEEEIIECHYCGAYYRLEHSEPNPPEYCCFCGTVLELEHDEEDGDY